MITDSIVMNREQIYNEIWQISMTKMAKKYNLNYAKLVGACKENNIPYPTASYWSKKNMGMDISSDIIPLPTSEVENITLYLKNNNSSLIENNDTVEDEKELSNAENVFGNIINALEFLEEDERNKVAKVIYELDIDKHRNMHKVISAYKNKIKEERREERQRNYYNPYYNIHEYVETGYFVNISKFEKERCMKILSSIYYAIEELGGKVNDDFSIKIRNELITIEIEELKTKVNHEITKEEAKKLLEYEEEKKRYKYASKPTIRKYDYVYNGKLKIIIESNNYVKETDSIKLENRLGDIIIKLYKKSEKMRVARIEREEAERKRAEEREKEEILSKKIREEVLKTKALVNCAEDYRIASEIRKFIEALASKIDIDDDTKKLIEWANKKADWFDPTISITDELLGKRNHEDSIEDKDRELDGYTSHYRWR